MNTLLDNGEQLEQELAPDPKIAPAAGSLLLHVALAVFLLTYGLLAGLLHPNQWGGAGSGGAIQVSLTNALPLPSDQPPNENVLATDTPSQAPAEPAPKTKQAADDSTLEIAGKHKKQPQTMRKSPQHPPENRAQYGEQAGSSMQRSIAAQNGANGPVSISGGDFGSRFGWYVDGISRKMASDWNRYEVDQHTAKGTRSYIEFTIRRDGSVSNIKLDQSSGSQTLDTSCLRAAQRVDTFGALPAQYNQSTVMTSYYCEY